jgi:hypothetical protein
MRYTLLILALCGCAAQPVSNPYKMEPAPVQESLISAPLPPEPPSNPRQFKSLAVVPHANPGEQPNRPISIVYPAGINPNDYSWTVQHSSDMHTWQDLAGAPLTGVFDLPRMDLPKGFFRMKGVKK